jgi:hypothetical protein
MKKRSVMNVVFTTALCISANTINKTGVISVKVAF